MPKFNGWFLTKFFVCFKKKISKISKKKNLKSSLNIPIINYMLCQDFTENWSSMKSKFRQMKNEA